MPPNKHETPSKCRKSTTPCKPDFNVYFRQHGPVLRTKYPFLDNTQIKGKVQEQWKKLPASEKAFYLSSKPQPNTSTPKDLEKAVVKPKSPLSKSLKSKSLKTKNSKNMNLKARKSLKGALSPCSKESGASTSNHITSPPLKFQGIGETGYSSGRKPIRKQIHNRAPQVLHTQPTTSTISILKSSEKNKSANVSFASPSQWISRSLTESPTDSEAITQSTGRRSSCSQELFKDDTDASSQELEYGDDDDSDVDKSNQLSVLHSDTGRRKSPRTTSRTTARKKGKPNVKTEKKSLKKPMAEKSKKAAKNIKAEQSKKCTAKEDIKRKAGSKKNTVEVEEETTKKRGTKRKAQETMDKYCTREKRQKQETVTSQDSADYEIETEQKQQREPDQNKSSNSNDFSDIDADSFIVEKAEAGDRDSYGLPFLTSQESLNVDDNDSDHDKDMMLAQLYMKRNRSISPKDKDKYEKKVASVSNNKWSFDEASNEEDLDQCTGTGKRAPAMQPKKVKAAKKASTKRSISSKEKDIKKGNTVSNNRWSFDEASNEEDLDGCIESFNRPLLKLKKQNKPDCSKFSSADCFGFDTGKDEDSEQDTQTKKTQPINASQEIVSIVPLKAVRNDFPSEDAVVVINNKVVVQADVHVNSDPETAVINSEIEEIIELSQDSVSDVEPVQLQAMSKLWGKRNRGSVNVSKESDEIEEINELSQEEETVQQVRPRERRSRGSVNISTDCNMKSKVQSKTKTKMEKATQKAQNDIEQECTDKENFELEESQSKPKKEKSQDDDNDEFKTPSIPSVSQKSVMQRNDDKNQDARRTRPGRPRTKKSDVESLTTPLMPVTLVEKTFNQAAIPPRKCRSTSSKRPQHDHSNTGASSTSSEQSGRHSKCARKSLVNSNMMKSPSSTDESNKDEPKLLSPFDKRKRGIPNENRIRLTPRPKEWKGRPRTNRSRNEGNVARTVVSKSDCENLDENDIPGESKPKTKSDITQKKPTKFNTTSVDIERIAKVEIKSHRKHPKRSAQLETHIPSSSESTNLDLCSPTLHSDSPLDLDSPELDPFANQTWTAPLLQAAATYQLATKYKELDTFNSIFDDDAEITATTTEEKTKRKNNKGRALTTESTSASGALAEAMQAMRAVVGGMEDEEERKELEGDVNSDLLSSPSTLVSPALSGVSVLSHVSSERPKPTIAAPQKKGPPRKKAAVEATLQTTVAEVHNSAKDMCNEDDQADLLPYIQKIQQNVEQSLMDMFDEPNPSTSKRTLMSGYLNISDDDEDSSPLNTQMDIFI